MAVRLVLHSAEHALVAQWREQRFPKPRVAGSIPAGGTEEFSQRFRGVVRNPPLTLQSRPQSVRSGERGDERFGEIRDVPELFVTQPE
jgi:hypothetical protein